MAAQYLAVKHPMGVNRGSSKVMSAIISHNSRAWTEPKSRALISVSRR